MLATPKKNSLRVLHPESPLHLLWRLNLQLKEELSAWGSKWSFYTKARSRRAGLWPSGHTHDKVGPEVLLAGGSVARGEGLGELSRPS